jgi:hypothetical protein
MDTLIESRGSKRDDRAMIASRNGAAKGAMVVLRRTYSQGGRAALQAVDGRANGVRIRPDQSPTNMDEDHPTAVRRIQP